MEPIHGYVQNVTDRVIGATVQTAYTAGGTSLVVDDASVFSTLGGTLFFEDEDTGSETVAYSAVDLDTDTLTIAAATYNHAAGIQVWDYPQNAERFAWVQTDDPDLAPLYCRVPHALRAMLAPGARSSLSGDDDSGDYVPEEEVLVEFDGRDWVVRDVLRKDPAVTVNIGDASITEDAIYLGDVNLGDVESDNVVTVNRSRIVRFIDPTNGSDDYDGMMPKGGGVVDTFNRTTASGWGNASSGFSKLSVTGVAATDIFTSAAHGYSDGDMVQFDGMTGGAGLTAGTNYFVISSTTNTFQVSTTYGGSAVNFTTDLTVGTVQKGYYTWTKETGTLADFSTTTTPDARMSLGISDEKVIRLNTGGALAEEVYYTTQANKAPSTGIMDVSLIFRAHTKRTIANDGQGLMVQFGWTTTAAAPTLRPWKLVDGTYTALIAAANVAGGNWATNTEYAVRAQCYDVAGVTYLRARAWKTSGSEPTSWDFSTSVTDQTYVTDRGGQIAFRSSTGAIANNPIVARVNAFEYTVLDMDLLAADDSDGSIPVSGVGPYDYVPATTPGVTQGPYATIGRALRDVPVYNAAEVFLIMPLGQKGGNGDGITGVLEEQPTVSGLTGGGKLVITGANPYWLGSLYLVGCSHNIVVSGITLSDPGDSQDGATLNINLSRYVEVYQCLFEGNTTQATYNVLFQQGSTGTVQNCQLHGAPYCVGVDTSSYVLLSTNTGSGATASYRITASMAQSTGTVPTGGFSVGTTGMMITNGTGSSNTNISSTSSAPTTGGGTSPPTSTKKTKTWAISAGSTYGMSYGTWAAGDVVQGAYGGGQNHKGVWKMSSALFSTLSGKTLSSGYITVTRRGYGGSSGAQPIYIVSYTDNDFSGSPTVLSGPTLLGSLSWGQTKTFKLPAGILGDLNDGTNRALGIYQPDGAPYVIMAPGGKVKVTYTP